MLKPRLIPILLIRDGGLMKSRQFSSWTYVGDPINTSKIFNDKDTDELVVLDVNATAEGREPNYRLLEQLAAECFLPIAYGGGVSTAAIAKKVIKCGVDKVAVNAGALTSPALLGEISDILGSSSTVASVDARNSQFGYEINNRPSVNLIDYLSKLQSFGAGEILVQSVDRDGTKTGPDVNLARVVLEATELPIIYAGGVSSLDHAVELWRMGIDGVGAGSWFVFSGSQDAVLVTYPSPKRVNDALGSI